MTEKTGLEGLPSRKRLMWLNIGAWGNGGLAMLFLSLFLKYGLRQCIPLEKYEEVMNARLLDAKAQIEREAQAKAAQVVLPQVREVQNSIDTLRKGIDSLKIGV
jgi:hypothetical protein